MASAAATNASNVEIFFTPVGATRAPTSYSFQRKTKKSAFVRPGADECRFFRYGSVRVLNRQFLDAVDPAVAEAARLAQLADVRHAVGNGVEHDLDLKPGQVRADAVVRAVSTEGEVRVRVAG